MLEVNNAPMLENMSVINERVSKQLETMKQVYIKDPHRILQDYRKEKAEIEGYHGRELLELLQNAVDELESSDKRFVCIDLNDNVLRFSNNGSVFSFDGIVSIMYSNLSPKHNRQKYIGNKGTGFRAVLNWAKGVRIYSGDLSVEFSPVHSEMLMHELLEHTNVANYKLKNRDLKVATLTVPRIIDPLHDKEYDTIIEIELMDSMLVDVIAQIESLNSRTLIFLDSLDKLTIINNSTETIFTKKTSLCANNIKSVLIETEVNDMSINSEEWIIAFEDGKIEDHHYQVAVAYKEDLSVEADVLYSFFRTQVSFPIPALVHGTFDLSANRNNLNQTNLNKLVLEASCRLLIETTLSMNGDKVDYFPLQLLSLRKAFPLELKWTKIEEFYYKTLAKSRVFPTVNFNYISFDDNPFFYKSQIAKFLSGAHFSSLLQYTEDDAVSMTIHTLAKQYSKCLSYEFSHITKGINLLLSKLSDRERADLCLAFLSEYSTIPENEDPPRFLLTSNNRPVGKKQYVFLPPEKDNDASTPPEFADFAFLQKTQLSAFKEIIGNSISVRQLADRLSVLRVREYNFTEIVRGVISQLNNKDHKGSKKTTKHCAEMINWLWRLHRAGRMSELNLQSLNIPIVARDSNMHPAKNLYIGIEYENDITETLLIGIDELFIASPDMFEVKPTDLDSFLQFLTDIGVERFPRTLQLEMKNIPYEYRRELSKKFKYPIQAGTDVNLKNEREALNAITHVNVTVFEHYEYILENASTLSIISWLRKDDQARKIVTSQYELTSESAVYAKNGMKWNPRMVQGQAIASFMRFEFCNRGWISVENVRYPLYKCLLRTGINQQLLPYVVEPDFEAFLTKGRLSSVERSEVRSLFASIGAPENYSSLSTNQLYGILLILPEVDINGLLSKALYQSLIDNQGLVELNINDDNYRKFLQEGMVYASNRAKFTSIDDTVYITERAVSKVVIDNFNLIAISKRQNQETIKKYLGVNSLKIKGKIVGTPEPHPLNDEFFNDFSKYKAYSFCYRLEIAKQPEIALMKSLHIVLCSSLEANVYEIDLPIDDYSFIKGADAVYLKVPIGSRSLEALRKNTDFCASIAEIITSTIDILDNKLFSDLRALYGLDDVGRNSIILQDFDNLDILRRSQEALELAQSIKDQFRAACLHIGGQEVNETIDKDISSINFDSINDSANFAIYRKILDILRVDILEFNNVSGLMIDFAYFYRHQLNTLVDINKHKYKNVMFDLLVNKSLDEQRTFLDRIEHFITHSFNINNTKSLDIDILFYDKWPELKEQEANDADLHWKQNRILFSEGKDMDVVNELLADNDFNSLMYFGAFELLNEMYEKRLSEWKKKNDMEENIKEYSKVAPAPIEKVEVMPTEPNTQITMHGVRIGNKNAGMKRERPNAVWGAYAENVVYETYSQLYRNVKWVSENAKKKGVNPDGVGGLGYDLIYTDDYNNIVYVEIKSTTSDSLSFVITENELEFGEKNGDAYEVALVVNVESDNRKIHPLRGLFSYHNSETRYSNSNYYLSADNYVINCRLRDR